MNRLWVRLSLSFGIVFILSTAIIGLVFRTSAGGAELEPPEEVVAYFQMVRDQNPEPSWVLPIVAGIATIAGVLLSRTLAAPMSNLEVAANQIGQGDLSTRVVPRGSQEMVAVATAFNEMAARLEQSESSRQTLLADIAHELRHPLHVLQGNLQAMQDGVYPLNQEELGRLIEQTHHLTVMVNDLHVLAQAEEQRLPLQRQEVDMAALVKDITAVYQPIAAGKEIDLHVELLGTIPSAIHVDKARIRQAIQNLLENSLRHTHERGRITLSLRQQDQHLLVTVTDTGEGIAENQIDLVFDRLYRGDKARLRSGQRTGLGLPISKAIVEAHDGTLTAASPGVNQGSTFQISLPLV